MHDEIEMMFANIEKAAKDQPLEVMPQILSVSSFIRHIYEHSVDLADLVV
jgi:hypothetical protein